MRFCPRFRRHWLLLPLFFALGTALAHDLTTSHATIRLKPGVLELQVKIATDTAWAIVQETHAAGAAFVLEEFETVGRQHLLSFARTMEELTIDGRIVSPRSTNVEIVEDNFIFTFVFGPLAPGRALLTEKYLKEMPGDYTSRVTVADENEKQLAAKTLTASDTAFSFNFPNIAKIPASPRPR